MQILNSTKVTQNGSYKPKFKCICINILVDNIGENLDDLVYGDTFLDTIAKT